jgi:predicted HicB family RNase H-like nuclease
LPNQPKTPNRTVRIDDELWTAARLAAEANGESVTDVVRRALQRYVRRAQQSSQH